MYILGDCKFYFPLYSVCHKYIDKEIILIDDSPVMGFQGYRVSQIHLTPVDYPIATLL